MARGDGFDSKKDALQTMAAHLAGSAEANGLENELDGMGYGTSDLSPAEVARAEWAIDEVCRRLRNMGERRR